MTFNALGTEMADGKGTLAKKLGIKMPEDKPEKLEAKVLDTENLAEIVVELSNADLVKNTDALLNPANYRLSNGVKVQHAHLDGDNVVLTLVPYGKVEEQGKFDSLIKGKKFDLTIRNIDPAINGTYRNIVPEDNAIPVVESVDFIGTHGIKIVTSEPIANPLERNFRLNSRTSMIVEQYGRNIILTPYHGKEFDKETVELTIDKLEDFAGYTSVSSVEKMEISTDEALPKVEAAYRSGKELVVVFDRDVYHNSVKAYENRRALGNASFVERRVPFYTEKAEKIDTNVVKYTFTRDIPRGMEVTIEGVANHFNKAMEKENILPVEYKDDYAPVIIDFDDVVAVSDKNEADLAKLYEDKGEKEYNKELDAGYKVETLAMTIEFDKDIAEFINAKPQDIKVKDHFTLYELDITKRGENIAREVEINVKDIDKDSIELTFENIKINNKDRDFDYILEVRNFSDTNRNRMEREYLDFQVVRQGKAFDVVVKDIKDTRYFNRTGSEIVLEFNKVVNKEAAQDAKNYYLDGKLHVSEAIVERDGRTVSLVVYDKDAKKLVNDYKVLEISPRVVQLDWPYSAPAHRFFDLNSKKAIADPVEDRNAAKKVEGLINALPEIDKLTVENIKAIEDAKKAYDNLTPEQEKLVGETLAKKLEGAVDKLPELKKEADDKKGAANVEKLIEALPEPYQLKLGHKEKVEEANEAFKNLSDEAKALVSKDLKAKLDAVVKKLEEIKQEDQTLLNEKIKLVQDSYELDKGTEDTDDAKKAGVEAKVKEAINDSSITVSAEKSGDNFKVILTKGEAKAEKDSITVTIAQ